MDPCTMVTVCVLGALLFAAFERIVWYRKETRLKELEVRELEAKVQLVRHVSRDGMPEYVDSSDPAAVDAWKRAQLELGRAVAEGPRRL